MLKDQIVRIIKLNPGYGLRRIQSSLTEQFPQQVNHKRLRRVLGTYHLGLMRCLPASNPPATQKLIGAAGTASDLVKGRSFPVLEAFSTDFSELVYAQGQKKAWLMVLLDIASRWSGGWAVGQNRNRGLALRCLDDLVSKMAALGRNLRGVIIHQDRDSVYTSYEWIARVLIEEEARLSYAENGAKDNPWIESFWGRFKTENRELLLEADSLEEVMQIVDRQLIYYNEDRLHSGLEYQRPSMVLLSTLARENIVSES
jgi:putative transposase